MQMNEGAEIPVEPKMPECEKMVAVQPVSQQIGMFLEWLGENGYAICEMMEETRHGWGQSPWSPARLSIEQMLAKYHEIDLNEVERERRAALEFISAQGQAYERTL